MGAQPSTPGSRPGSRGRSSNPLERAPDKKPHQEPPKSSLPPIQRHPRGHGKDGDGAVRVSKEVNAITSLLEINQIRTNESGNMMQVTTKPKTLEERPPSALVKDGKEMLSLTGLDDERQQCMQSASFQSDHSASHASSTTGALDARPRIRVNEAKELFHRIFNPRSGQLECFASGFISPLQFKLMGDFLSGFLGDELRDKWVVDAVMLSVLGKDRWRFNRGGVHSSRGSGGGTTGTAKAGAQHFIQQRREHTDQLRTLLMELSGAVEAPTQHSRKTSLRALLQRYRSMENIKDGVDRSGDQSPNASSSLLHNLSSTGDAGDGRAATDGRVPVPPADSLYVTRLRTTVSTSFDCYHLIASRIPMRTLSITHDDYFLNSTPVVDERCTYKEQRIGDLAVMSFFVSMKERARLLRGLSTEPPDSINGGDGGANLDDILESRHFTGEGFRSALATAAVASGADRAEDKTGITSGADVYNVMRNLGLVLTTACSSMVLFVLFHLAESIQARRRFRELRDDAVRRGVSLESCIGKEEATIKTFKGEAGEGVAEWRRYVATDEMNMATFTRLIVKQFRRENRRKIEQLRRKYFELFAFLEALAPEEEKKDFDASRMLSGIVLKLMFLCGGGQRSIGADDRRIPNGTRNSTDDLYLSRMLQVPVLSQICWVACMMGMPMMTSHGLLVQKRQSRPLTFIEVDECTGVLQELFQAVGALPHGTKCPTRYIDWLQLFPLYAVNTEGKRILTYLYIAHFGAIKRLPMTIQKDVALLSCARQLKGNKTVVNSHYTSSYCVVPEMTVGFSEQETERPKPRTSSVSGGGVARSRRSSSKDGPPAPSGHSNAGRKLSDMSFSFNMNTSPSHDEETAVQGRRRCDSSKDLSSLDDDSTSSCSALLPGDLDIDVYTCVSLQAQLYLRCAHEANVKRHKSTELTPFSTTEFYHTSKDLSRLRSDIAPALLRRTPKLRPSEAILIVRWEVSPVVTFQRGDTLSVMVERLPKERRYFTGAQRRVSESGRMSGAGASANGDPYSLLSPHMPQIRRRSQVVIDTAATRDSDMNNNNSNYNNNNSSGSSHCHHSGANNHNGTSTHGSLNSSAAPENPCTTFMRDVFGISGGANEDSLSNVGDLGGTRVAMHWTVKAMYTPQQLLRRRNTSSTDRANRSSRQQLRSREVILLVSCAEMHLTEPLKIVTFGHQRNTMSAFSTLGKGSGVCWTNMVLLNALFGSDGAAATAGREGGGGGGGGAGGATAVSGKTTSIEDVGSFLGNRRSIGSDDFSPLERYSFLGDSFMSSERSHGGSDAGRSGLTTDSSVDVLCNTVDELHDVMFAIGFLLANTIANGVYLTIPFAPLVFSLLKQAVSSGDHSLKSFTWLEPSDGNLLSSTHVLNSAFEVMCMSDAEYYTFLRGQGISTPDNLVFPVTSSVAAVTKTMRELSSTPSLSVSTQPSDMRDDTSLLYMRAVANVSITRKLVHTTLGIYLDAIRTQNKRSCTFHRHSSNDKNSILPSTFEGGKATAAACDVSSSVLNGVSPSSGSMRNSSFGNFDSAEVTRQLIALPSREEYIALYLVTYLTWGSVQRGGRGDKGRNVWVNLVKGFMTSPIAKSPLMTLCCSRVIREVLCMSSQ